MYFAMPPVIKALSSLYVWGLRQMLQALPPSSGEMLTASDPGALTQFA